MKERKLKKLLLFCSFSFFIKKLLKNKQFTTYNEYNKNKRSIWRGVSDMEQKNNTVIRNSRRQTRWDGLFVSEHAWESNYNMASDPQPMLSADEEGAMVDMLIVAYGRKCPVFIQSWQEGHFHYYRCTIRKLDREQWTITYEDLLGERQLAISMIKSIHMLD